jgi:hypothetical protein
MEQGTERVPFKIARTSIASGFNSSLSQVASVVFCVGKVQPASLRIHKGESSAESVGRFIRLDGPSRRTRHLNPEETLPENTKRLRISGIAGSEFPEPTSRNSRRCSAMQKPSRNLSVKLASRSRACHGLRDCSTNARTTSGQH